jgi:hypothetical protein
MSIDWCYIIPRMDKEKVRSEVTYWLDGRDPSSLAILQCMGAKKVMQVNTSRYNKEGGF